MDMRGKARQISRIINALVSSLENWVDKGAILLRWKNAESSQCVVGDEAGFGQDEFHFWLKVSIEPGSGVCNSGEGAEVETRILKALVYGW
jgi:hypothetical protein